MQFTKEQLIAKLQHRLTVAAKYPEVEEAELDAAIFKIALASLEAGSDSNSHPAHGPLTTERLHQLRDAFLRTLQYSNGGNMNYIIADAVKAIDEVLEVRKAEPVGEVVLGEYDDCGRHPDARVVCIAADGQADWENFRDGTRLYAVTPAPVVPEEATPGNIEILASARVDSVVFQWDEDQRNAAADSWNACRSAMLNGGKS